MQLSIIKLVMQNYSMSYVKNHILGVNMRNTLLHIVWILMYAKLVVHFAIRAPRTTITLHEVVQLVSQLTRTNEKNKYDNEFKWNYSSTSNPEW